MIEDRAAPVPPDIASGFAFPQHFRLKTPKQFQAIYNLKKSASDSILIVYAGPNELPHPRVGLSVSKKVGHAVVRNRFKRLFREAFRLTRPQLPNVDLIMIPRPHAGEPTLEQLKQSLVKLAHQAARRLAPKPEATP